MKHVFAGHIFKRRAGRAKPLGILAGGGLTAQSCARGIALAVSEPLSGGAGRGFRYSIYRGTTPDFIANKFSLLTEIAALPYVDETVETGVHYFYSVVGSDAANASIALLPAGIFKWPSDDAPTVTAVTRRQALNIIFAGDSITYGLGVTNAGTVKLPTMPGFCIMALRRLSGLGEIYGSNQGHNSHTLTDYAPGGMDYHDAFDCDNSASAASQLRALHPEAQMIVSLMLGTNDSAMEGSNNAPFVGPLAAEHYSEKLHAIIDRILRVDVPDAKIIIHMPPYYSANSRTSFVYSPLGLMALMSYGPAIGAVVENFAVEFPDQVFRGDSHAFEYFAQTYATEHQPQHYRGSTFYLHPSGTHGVTGLIGTQSLGELHAAAIAQII